MLRIENLTKTYGEVKAVDSLSLHIAAGEIYGFIGHNGAGKTTTIKSCCGILDFDSGNIFINGTSIKENPLFCKSVLAYIPDNPDIYEFMTGIQYLNFIADIFNVDADVRQERIRKYSDLFEITSDLAQPIRAYSHGMKQKLAVISALIHEPKLVIMDEPFVGLDPKAAHILKGIMRDICNNGGAIFFSTHVLEVAEKLCDKIAIINIGNCIANETPFVSQLQNNDNDNRLLVQKPKIAIESNKVNRRRVLKSQRRKVLESLCLCVSAFFIIKVFR